MEEKMSRCLIRILQLMFFAVILVFTSTAIAANSTDQLEKQLAGMKAREWVFARFDMFMSTSKCKQGESYRFKADHSVTISSCVDGKVQEETLQWPVASDRLETRLKIGSTSYILQ